MGNGGNNMDSHDPMRWSGRNSRGRVLGASASSKSIVGRVRDTPAAVPPLLARDARQTSTLGPIRPRAVALYCLIEMRPANRKEMQWTVYKCRRSQRQSSSANCSHLWSSNICRLDRRRTYCPWLCHNRHFPGSR
eukprot:gene14778-biopygen12660